MGASCVHPSIASLTGRSVHSVAYQDYAGNQGDDLTFMLVIFIRQQMSLELLFFSCGSINIAISLKLQIRK